MQVDFLPAELPRKPKNTGVGSLSFLKQIDPGIELGSPALQVDSLQAELPGGKNKKNFYGFRGLL